MLKTTVLILLAASAVLAQKVTGTGAAVPLLPHAAGYNNQTAPMLEPWQIETRREGLVKARPTLLRYPGGSVANYWDMQRDKLFTPVVEIDPEGGASILRKYTLAWVASLNGGQMNSVRDLRSALDYSAEKSQNGAPAVIFVMNMVTPGPEYYAAVWKRAVDQTPGSGDWWNMLDDRYRRNLDMLERAEALGVPIRYVEFGNEYYFGAGAANPAGATVEPYVAGVIPNDPNLAGAFPGLGKDYACAVNDWARKLRARFPGVRLCAVAGDPRGGARRRDWNLNVARFVDRDLVPAVSFHHYGGITAGNLTENAEQLHETMWTWRESWIEIQENARELTDREFWLTEWNSNTSQGTWGHGLHSLFCLHTWLSGGNFGLSAYHQFSNNTVLAGQGPDITATARAMSLFSLATAGMRRALPLVFDGVPSAPVPAFFGWKFTKGDSTGEKYMLVNLGGEERTIDVSSLTAEANLKVHQARAPLNREMIDPGETVSSSKSQLKLPAFSVTVWWPDAAAQPAEGCPERQQP